MEREAKPVSDYLAIIFFIMIWMGLFFLLIGLLFARHIGLKLALQVSLGFWFFVIIVFILILLLNVTYLLYRRFRE